MDTICYGVPPSYELDCDQSEAPKRAAFRWPFSSRWKQQHEFLRCTSLWRPDRGMVASKEVFSHHTSRLWTTFWNLCHGWCNHRSRKRTSKLYAAKNVSIKARRCPMDEDIAWATRVRRIYTKWNIYKWLTISIKLRMNSIWNKNRLTALQDLAYEAKSLVKVEGTAKEVDDSGSYQSLRTVLRRQQLVGKIGD